ncbi:MAG: transcriptional regulator [endosymbiont of Galathealinum brachiosum]|uniref:Transcriptional regulator n=1 Tax=endosymbiont of Galathealinum brachiosum TaxID=2200906 RepID=A0A370DGL5_9GAMM|nr:MAG: transcriptional regulator [endosymbiont of Galathealinum brachiosum]
MNKSTTKTDKTDFLKRSECPITNSLDIIGDKWTLLIIRDLFIGKKTYSEFQQSPEGIPTNILSDRLKRLQVYGIIDKSPYQERPVRYEYLLTKQGKALGEILTSIKDWGLEFIPGTNTRLVDEYLKKQQQDNEI